MNLKNYLVITKIDKFKVTADENSKVYQDQFNGELILIDENFKNEVYEKKSSH